MVKRKFKKFHVVNIVESVGKIDSNFLIFTMSNIVGNSSNVESMVVHHKFMLSRFNNGNCAKLVFSQVCVFCTHISCFKNRYDARINIMEHYHPYENISFCLYMHHTYFKHMNPCAKNTNP